MDEIDFNKIREKLFRYSLKIAGAKWEAEDLAQEALVRLWRSLEAHPKRSLTNAYLYRIVINLWIDRQRKLKAHSYPIEKSDEYVSYDSEMVTRELLEFLSNRISPKAMAILLLMDIFDYTAKEVAVFLGSTEGNVHVTLGRARARLNRLSSELDFDETTLQKDKGDFRLDDLVDAFRRRDAKALCETIVGLSGLGYEIRQIKWNDKVICFYIRDPDGHLFMIRS